MKQKIVIVGLDGATFDVIDPLIKRGWLPNIEKLIQRGTRGALRSTIHPITPQAWSTFLTGKNGGKHGIFDFTHRRKDTYDIEFVNAGRRRSESVFQYLSRRGLTVGAVAIPFTYPPEEVNGFMLAGFDAPAEDAKSVHPAALYREIQDNFGNYYIHLASPVGRRNKEEAFWRDIQMEDKNRTDICLYLMERQPCDLFMVVYNNTDRVQHLYLTYDFLDNLETTDSETLEKHLIVRTYRNADEQLGRILDVLDRGTLVILMSDHGSGPIRRVFFLNRWLEEKEFLTYRPAPRLGCKATEKARYFSKRFFPRWAKGFIKGVLPGVRDKVESYRYFSDILWDKTMAYGFGMYGNIFVNLKGREPLGIVCREDYEKVRRAIQDQLIDLRDPNSGERLIDRIYRREDLYSGLYVEDAPDLILRWKDYSYYTAVTPGREKGSIFGDFLRIDSSDFEHLGTHRLDGIFVAAGKGIPENTTIEGARIEDLAPTLVFSLHQPVPQDMDGRVLPHLFTAEHLEGREPEYVYFDTTSQDISKKGEYSDSESKKVEERLKGLGYM